jgi:hypothetical protein
MGFLATDLNVISSTGPTTNIPVSKDVNVKAFQVARTDTSSTLKAVLPGDASILNIVMTGSSNSDAGTTATVTIVVSDNTGAISTGTAVNVKTAGATTAIVQMPSLPNLQPVPLTGDLKITATYAETGTASTTGGPYTFIVTYIR